MSFIEKPKHSCSEAGDIQAKADRLIHIGVTTNHRPSLDLARKLMREIMPRQVADSHFTMMVEDARGDLVEDER